MTPSSRRAFLFLSALSFGHGLGAPPSLCPDCGRESRAGETTCRGCGKRLTSAPAASEPQPTPGDTPEPDSTAAPLDSVPVERDAAAARAALRDKQWHQAGFYSLNGLALHSLSREKKEGLAAELKALSTQATAALATRPVPCPICSGSGSRVELAITMKGEARKLQGPNLLCLACSGVKTVPAMPAADELRAERTAARRVYDESAKQKGGQLLHGVWLPSGFDASVLPLRSWVRLRQITAGPCSSCIGIGRQSCKSCEGRGLLPCSDRECVAGRTVCPTCDGRKVEESEVGSQTSVRTCRTCQGRGIAPCETCQGKGLLTCRRCEGLKSTACRDCDGNGESEACRRCQGGGVLPCARCKGTGESKGKPCESCQGQREGVCQTCEGSGRKSGYRP